MVELVRLMLMSGFGVEGVSVELNGWDWAVIVNVDIQRGKVR